MTKKELILKVLQKLKDKWDIADWLIDIISWKEEINDSFLDWLIKIFNTQLNNTKKNNKLKKSLEKWVMILHDIKNQEENLKKEELIELEALISNI